MNEWNSSDDLVLPLKKMSNMIFLHFTFQNKCNIDKKLQSLFFVVIVSATAVKIVLLALDV